MSSWKKLATNRSSQNLALTSSRSTSTIVPVIGKVNKNFRLPVVESVVSKKRAD